MPQTDMSAEAKSCDGCRWGCETNCGYPGPCFEREAWELPLAQRDRDTLTKAAEKVCADACPRFNERKNPGECIKQCQIYKAILAPLAEGGKHEDV